MRLADSVIPFEINHEQRGWYLQSSKARASIAGKLPDTANSAEDSHAEKSPDETLPDLEEGRDAQDEADVSEEPQKVADASEVAAANAEVSQSQAPSSAGDQAPSPKPIESQARNQSVSEQIRQQHSIDGARLTSQKTVEAVFADCEKDEDGGISKYFWPLTETEFPLRTKEMSTQEVLFWAFVLNSRSIHFFLRRNR